MDENKPHDAPKDTPKDPPKVERLHGHAAFELLQQLREREESESKD